MSTRKDQEVKYLLTMTAAQDKMLERLALSTGRTKADLIREGIDQLLGMYRNLLIEGDTVNDTAVR